MSEKFYSVQDFHTTWRSPPPEVKEKRSGWIKLANGEYIETIKLVEQLRRHRGRLPANKLAPAVGLKNSLTSIMMVFRLCKQYEISIPNDDPDYRPGVVSRDMAVLAAQDALAAEIAAAHAEADKTPPYRPGPMEWDQGARLKNSYLQLKRDNHAKSRKYRGHAQGVQA